jgi:hypothetical protein
MVSAVSNFDIELASSVSPRRQGYKAFAFGLVTGCLACAALAAVAFHQAPTKRQTSSSAPVQVFASATLNGGVPQRSREVEAKEMAMKMMMVDPSFQQAVERDAGQFETLLSDPNFQEQAKAMARQMKQVLTDPDFKGQANLPVQQREAQVAQQQRLKSLLMQQNAASAFVSPGAAAAAGRSAFRPKLSAASRAAVPENALLTDKAGKSKSEVMVKDFAGITEPLGFFDPIGFSKDVSEGRLRFYREVELKHGRVAMLASVGFLVGEQFHPLFGGDIDVPAYLAFQQTPLETFWLSTVFAIGVLETFSVFTFNSPFGGEPWSIRSDHAPGNLGFDPLGLKPTDPKELKEMETKEINNGRLAMIAAAGMIAQEFVSGQKLF